MILVDNDNGNSPKDEGSARETADFISDMALGLMLMARRAELSTLAELLSQVSVEASRVLREHNEQGSTVRSQ